MRQKRYVGWLQIWSGLYITAGMRRCPWKYFWDFRGVSHMRLLWRAYSLSAASCPLPQILPTQPLPGFSEFLHLFVTIHRAEIHTVHHTFKQPFVSRHCTCVARMCWFFVLLFLFKKRNDLCYWHLNDTFSLLPKVCISHIYFCMHICLTLKRMIFICFPINYARLSWNLTVHRLFMDYFPLWKHSCFIMENVWKLHLHFGGNPVESHTATFSRLLFWVLFLSEGLLCFEQEAPSSVTLPWPFFMPYWPWRRQWAPISSLERPLVLSSIAEDKFCSF